MINKWFKLALVAFLGIIISGFALGLIATTSGNRFGNVANGSLNNGLNMPMADSMMQPMAVRDNNMLMARQEMNFMMQTMNQMMMRMDNMMSRMNMDNMPPAGGMSMMGNMPMGMTGNMPMGNMGGMGGMGMMNMGNMGGGTMTGGMTGGGPGGVTTGGTGSGGGMSGGGGGMPGGGGMSMM